MALTSDSQAELDLSSFRYFGFLPLSQGFFLLTQPWYQSKSSSLLSSPYEVLAKVFLGCSISFVRQGSFRFVFRAVVQQSRLPSSWREAGESRADYSVLDVFYETKTSIRASGTFNVQLISAMNSYYINMWWKTNLELHDEGSGFYV